MLEIGSQVLLGLPGPDTFQALHMGCVLETADGSHTVEFELEAFPGKVGQNGRLFFHTPEGFVQQPVRIEAILGDAPIPTARFSSVGDPVSAEGRQHPRISTVASELIATLGKESFCPVVDLSATGFAVMSSEPHEVGSVIEVTIESGAHRYSGTACVQSRRELWEGRFRFGLYCCDASDSSRTLRQGLTRISAELHAMAD